MKRIGLTGGIASGKSTVAAMLGGHGAQIIDADAVYHDLIRPRENRPSPLAERIEARFAGVVDHASGTVQRHRLAEHVFADAAERAALEALTHPAVAAEVARRMDGLRQKGLAVVFYEVPLLFEKGLQRGLDGTVVVWVPADEQLRRLRDRDGLSEAQARQRLAAQLPVDVKRERATWVIDNSGSLHHTQDQVQRLWAQLGGGAPAEASASSSETE